MHLELTGDLTTDNFIQTLSKEVHMQESFQETNA